ncbi:efflux RND transporter periplasmic adaptor subunit [Sphingosinicella microcystinivorans]|jgi:cobalt-zinc-cadmium efflux system membrane fusion protein|uniref:Cobalt-zinc-cadmium efflux system membrane fusion protein n=1 Tax=Sphingosinicella microcystinivorans TaxID=335406 RepID=A0AAD1D3E5_SPHMI|nr:efflux RND transporter periplasmic adaptor subunit [Sphingosinicella microcystinivorans]RKS84396.1 cobalt-zinc-cadmium efflux system membrane fusion protein [Sphingosinicella microcystinivorans]BBE33068.1 metal transporter [Sphingosinicella microcystinivorans]
MQIFETKNRLMAAVAVGALLLGGSGILIGRSMTAPEAAAPAASAEEEEEGHVEGQILMDEARAKGAGIVTETIQAGGLGSEILAQGVVAATPEGEAVLTARADGAITRINRRLGDAVRAGEAVAVMESRDAAAIASERSAASARLALARSTYAREKKLFDARITAKQDLEAAAAALAEAEAEARRSQSAAAAAKVSGDGRTLAVTSLISGRITKSDAKLGSYVLAGTELFRVSDPNRIQINASVLAADARRIKPGDTAVIELLGGETVDARVRSATPSLDPESKSATIILIPGGIAGLTPGQGLRARIKPQGGADSALIALPEEAVQTVEGREVVFVKTAMGFQATTVVTGKRGGGRIEIVDGVKPGEVIATRGAFLLKAEIGKGEAEH